MKVISNTAAASNLTPRRANLERIQQMDPAQTKNMKNHVELINRYESQLSFLLRNGRILAGHSRTPAIFGSKVLIKWPSLTRFLIEVLSIRTTLDLVTIPEQTPCTQFWQQEFDDVLERLWEQ